MRTLVDISETQLRRLDELARRERQSRAALIREAIDGYLDERTSKAASDAFGLWGKQAVDGLAYQRKVRSEW